MVTCSIFEIHEYGYSQSRNEVKRIRAISKPFELILFLYPDDKPIQIGNTYEACNRL